MMPIVFCKYILIYFPKFVIDTFIINGKCSLEFATGIYQGTLVKRMASRQLSIAKFCESRQTSLSSRGHLSSTVFIGVLSSTYSQV